MRTDLPKTTYLKDYTRPDFTVERLEMTVQLFEDRADVTSTLHIKRLNPKADTLTLNGEHISLLYLKVNNADLTKDQYFVNDKLLSIPGVHAEFTVTTKVTFDPAKNTALEGLYRSGDTYCTQCEPEGFRRITYMIDRPDVMATYTIRIEADNTLPVLLSNGNLIEKGALEGSRHFTVWHDPFPKPCYLFALVAGDLIETHDVFNTQSGKMVDLFIYTRKGDEGQVNHAMESLKKSFKWDEDMYGREYDLSVFNIVVVSDFNMGAMENKSLNIFNSALALAHKDTATDDDFINVEAVIAHEYFHNWTGNRITCRDWFQLSLKEGLTVFRDQMFTGDMHSHAAKRIDDVQTLRRFQFTEDAGPMAHPIRPDNYIEINNFYTLTVYEKGAEVIRMLYTLMGSENYRKATDLYFSRHDGQAVTCEDFIKCMEDTSGLDLKQFRLWYEQAGTPEITAICTYNNADKKYTVTLEQFIPPTFGQPHKKPMHIPVSFALIDKNGKEVEGSNQILHLRQQKQDFVFNNIQARPVPSILRGFSAPVRLKTNLSDDDLRFLMAHDTDGFNRWDCGQTLALRAVHKYLKGLHDDAFIKTWLQVLRQAADSTQDPTLMAEALSVPELSVISQDQIIIDPTILYNARTALMTDLAKAGRDLLLSLIEQNKSPDVFSISGADMGKRALKNKALGFLTYLKDDKDAASLAKTLYDNANNMTDRLSAFRALLEFGGKNAQLAKSDFYEAFKHHDLATNKWISAQTILVNEHTLPSLIALRDGPQFHWTNPNRVRALFSAFATNNPVCFHDPDGSGYAFVQDAILRLNTINPSIAARLLTPFKDWKRYTPDRQEKMKACLEKILAVPNLSNDVFEIVSKSLAA